MKEKQGEGARKEEQGKGTSTAPSSFAFFHPVAQNKKGERERERSNVLHHDKFVQGDKVLLVGLVLVASLVVDVSKEDVLLNILLQAIARSVCVCADGWMPACVQSLLLSLQNKPSTLPSPSHLIPRHAL